MAVSAGARSRATSTNGCPGFGTPGGGSFSRCAITRCEMSSRSAARSAMYPPMPASRSRYAANASYTARSAVLPVASSFVTSSIRLGSSAIIACASSTSFAAPPAFAPRFASSAATTESDALARSPSRSGSRWLGRSTGSGSASAIRTTGPTATPCPMPVPLISITRPPDSVEWATDAARYSS